MSKTYFQFNGAPLFSNSDWVGFIIIIGAPFVDFWLMRLLASKEVSGDSGIKICSLSGNNEQEIIDCADNSDIKPKYFSENLSIDDWRSYFGLFSQDHFLTSDSKKWRMIIPSEIQHDCEVYAIWAGEKSIWEKIEKNFRNLPKTLGDDIKITQCHYTDNNIFLKDDTSIPREIAYSLKNAQFIDE